VSARSGHVWFQRRKDVALHAIGLARSRWWSADRC
jgi:hypothetical protein